MNEESAQAVVTEDNGAVRHIDAETVGGFDDGGLGQLERELRAARAAIAAQQPQPAPDPDLLWEAFELIANASPFEPRAAKAWDQRRKEWVTAWHAWREASQQPQPAPGSQPVTFTFPNGTQVTVPAMPDEPQPAPEVRTCYCGTAATVVPGTFPHPDCDGSVLAQPAPELAAAMAVLAKVRAACERPGEVVEHTSGTRIVNGDYLARHLLDIIKRAGLPS